MTGTTSARVCSDQRAVASGAGEITRALRLARRGLSLAALLLCLFASSAALHALDPAKRIDQYGHDVWTPQHGLPGEAVYQTLQSRDGYLWLRTSGGLVRFDGVRFTSMDSVMGSEPVRALTMGADGDLLIRTTARTVVYRNGVFVDYHPPAALPDGDVGAIFETRQHDLLIGADDFVYSQDAAHGLRLVQRGTAGVSGFLQDERGKVWVGGATELFSYHAGMLTDELKLTLKAPISAMTEDREHRMWVGTSGGLFRLERAADGSHPQMEPVFPHEITGLINAITEDRDGNLWIATAKAGIFRMRGDSLSSFGAINSLTDNRALTVFEDREGSLWVGTSGGLDRFRDARGRTYTTLEGLPADATKSAVTGQDGSIYVFCDSGGLGRIKDGVVTSYKDIKGLTVFFGSSMYVDPAGTLWLGTVGGLTRLKDGKFTVYNKNELYARRFISAISSDDEGLILTTSDSIAYRFKEGRIEPLTIRGQATPLSTRGNYTFTIYRDPAGTLWFGTVDGLFHFGPGLSPADSRMKGIKFPVTTISGDGRGSLWLGGRTPGLIRYRISDGRVTHYKKADGLFDSYPSRILFDGRGDLWISTPSGIYQANRQDLDDFADGRVATVRTVVYGIDDGMKTSEASSPGSQPGGARGLDGKLWFTTPKGIVMIDPENLAHNQLVPPVVIENVVVDGTNMPANADLEIPPGRDKIEFHYTGLSLRVPDRVRFKYQLEGYDHQWVDAGSRRVGYYNNLPPGRYRFHVIASNDDGVWNDTGASIGFRLKPHFYQTGWFRGLTTLLLVMCAIGGHRLNTRLFRRRAAELRRLVEERTAELRESQRHLEQVAFLDSLTTLPNRRMFTQEFRKLLAISRRRRASFSLLMIDLDRFKPINDTMGHDAGDTLLVEAASRLKDAVRVSDCVARLGGDEFAILLAEEPDQISIDQICERIVRNFDPGVPYEGGELKTTPSIGIAVFPEHGESQEALCKSADMALYDAKRAGGNGWRWYRPERAEMSAPVR
ncbi:MAG TPA: diguanylate cyclase [Acidisarcina sp.]